MLTLCQMKHGSALTCGLCPALAAKNSCDGWKKRPGMLGLRYAFTQPHQANWMTDGTMDWLWPAAEKAGIPIALMASNYLPQVGQIAERDQVTGAAPIEGGVGHRHHDQDQRDEPGADRVGRPPPRGRQPLIDEHRTRSQAERHASSSG